ncbi:hypothetical protein [Halostella sp. PRR32]|uniref:hypothetical protein n=1 Tax=Halostella sp. PRR32 TaxID=3098147 RepID=UPI002B1CE7EA|nr:hypothetical protein [Halostella sp. PRR32]
MSDSAEDVQEDVDDVEETEPATPDEADGPDLDDDDMVDLPDEVVDKAAEADADDVEEAVDDADDQDETESSTETVDEDDVSLGHVYCKALGMGATIAKEHHGEGVDDFESEMDQYAMMARQCDLDTYVDKWADQHGGAEMTPAQGILVGTAMFAMSVAASDSTLATNAMEAAR